MMNGLNSSNHEIWTTSSRGCICGRGESVVQLSSSNDSVKLKSAEELSPVLKEMKKVKGPRFDLGSIMVGEKPSKA